MRKPDFIIIGAQKSASSFVQNCLSEHPDIYMPKGESSCFESPDFENGAMDELFETLAKQTEPVSGIKRPNIIGTLDAVERINRFCPQSKVIAVLRKPIERLVSSYYHRINYGFLPPINIEEGVIKLLDDPGFRKAYPRGKEIFEFGLYHKYLSRFHKQLKDSRLLTFLHEDLKEAPSASIRRCFQFLEVDDTYAPKCMQLRPQKVTYNLQRLGFLQRRIPYCYAYNEDKTRLYRRKMGLWARSYVKGLLAIDRYLLALIHKSEKPALSSTLSSRLNDIYREDIEQLESFIQRDLSSWKL